jgi:hypothetical protein
MLRALRLFRLRSALIAAVTAAGFPVAAHADDPRADLPWAVRGEAFVVSGAGPVARPGAGSVAATVQRTLFRRFAWEETLGWGAGNHEVRGKGAGLVLAGTARVAAWMSDGRSHALSFGLGTALVTGGGYGSLNFLFGEAGYEYRSRLGPSLIVVAGPDLLLSRPPPAACASDGWLCEKFRRGDLALVGHLRAGAGWGG